MRPTISCDLAHLVRSRDEARARVAELQAANERLRAALPGGRMTILQITMNKIREEWEAPLKARIAELEAEVAELRKDKARLDWIEQQCLFQTTLPQFWRNRNGKISFAPWDEAKLAVGDSVRAAIDASMEGK